MAALRQALAEYVGTVRALGMQFNWPALILQRFVDFLEQEGATSITIELALRWASQPRGAQPATWARRLSIARRFAMWVQATDPMTQIPPHGLLPARHRRQPPHIYTVGELAQLTDAAGRLHSRSGLRSHTYATLIGLLAASGLRPGEALALDQADVDLDTGVLAVRETKFGKSRFVPVAASVRAALLRYAACRDALAPQRETPAFLVSLRGRRVPPCTAQRTFAKLSQTIGIRARREGRRVGRGPRLQDLRHTFATCRILAWYRAGLDVQRLMPALATYLGHGRVQDTYWYIEAVPELLQLATEHQARRTAGGER